MSDPRIAKGKGATGVFGHLLMTAMCDHTLFPHSLTFIPTFFSLPDTPSSSNWDDDDVTPPMKSSWDLPTPLRTDERDDASEHSFSKSQRSSRDRDRDKLVFTLQKSF
jgi:hypothetical protein